MSHEHAGRPPEQGDEEAAHFGHADADQTTLAASIHQDELEMELAISFTRLKPAVIGSDYLVVGTVDKRYWKAGLIENPATLEGMRAKMADFTKIYRLE